MLLLIVSSKYILCVRLLEVSFSDRYPAWRSIFKMAQIRYCNNHPKGARAAVATDTSINISGKKRGLS